MDLAMKLDADQSHQREWSFPTVAGEISDDFSSHSINQDLDDFGQLNVRAIHYHMHDMGTAMKIDHIRDGQILQAWHADHWKGYGPNQSFKILPASSQPFKKGDIFKTTCTYKAGRTKISHGVGHG